MIPVLRYYRLYKSTWLCKPLRLNVVYTPLKIYAYSKFQASSLTDKWTLRKAKTYPLHYMSEYYKKKVRA